MSPAMTSELLDTPRSAETEPNVRQIHINQKAYQLASRISCP